MASVKAIFPIRKFFFQHVKNMCKLLVECQVYIAGILCLSVNQGNLINIYRDRVSSRKNAYCHHFSFNSCLFYYFLKD